MKLLVLVTARGGSKRLVGKNTRLLGGRPLVTWSIDIAKNIPEVCDILVSTDDFKIAEICQAAGALVPWLRPAVLATDTASSVDVVLHALDWYENHRSVVDGVILLQPTSPYRTVKTVCSGIELFERFNRRPVVAVSQAHDHPMWTLKKEGEYLAPFLDAHGLGQRSQDLPPAFVVNGSLYIISPLDLRTMQSFFGLLTIPLIIESQQEALDIDTEWDWTMAEAALATCSLKTDR
jgi:CMP-N,N'-diacetyllegionaminic acid synthase